MDWQTSIESALARVRAMVKMARRAEREARECGLMTKDRQALLDAFEAMLDRGELPMAGGSPDG